MKVTEVVKDRSYTVRRATSREPWPIDWAKACGMAASQVPSALRFHDGAFIAETVEVVFAPPEVPKPPKRVMIQKWADSLPNRMAIIKFWEWLQKESPTFDQASSGFNLEKLLDRYHEIDRNKLDDERRAMLEQH